MNITKVGPYPTDLVKRYEAEKENHFYSLKSKKICCLPEDRIMGLLERFRSEEGEYFQYRKSVKFICEILIAISSVTALSCIGTMVGLGFQIQSPDQNFTHVDDEVPHRDVSVALFVYTVVILIVSISDIIFTIILRVGIQKLKLSYCLFWRGATVTSLVVVGMLTLAFITMVQDLIVILGYIPSLISKPFSLWIVNGFINELGELRSFPEGMYPPAKPSFSMEDLDSVKRTTTVFYNDHSSSKRFSQNPYVIPGSGTLRSIPE